MSARKDNAGAAPVKPNERDSKGAAQLTDDTVREFLKDNGDFLQRNPELLDHLHVSHASGSAVSLVEKQVSVMRERNVDLRHRLNALTANARENDKLYELTRALVVKLMEATSVDELYRIFIDSMRSDFEVEFASMILFRDEHDENDYRVDSLENARSSIGSLLSGRKAVCGALRAEEFNYVFSSDQTSEQSGSAALMPLNDSELRGLIAIGSSDSSRYSSDMGVLFLAHIAEIILRLMSRLSRPAA